LFILKRTPKKLITNTVPKTHKIAFSFEGKILSDKVIFLKNKNTKYSYNLIKFQCQNQELQTLAIKIDNLKIEIN